MTNQQIALEYIRCFCAGDIEGLEPIMANNLKFSGTFVSFDSLDEYLDSLRNDPPEKCQYRVLSITENSDSVALFYDYEKPNGVIRIAQLFKISDEKINEILLVFNGGEIS